MDIDLSPYTEGVRIFLGFERGKKLRETLNLNELEEKEESIILIFPQDFFAVQASFVQGLLCEAVKKFGLQDTLKKYIFMCGRSVYDDIIVGLKHCKQN
jgi:hypothetical protein